jgi:hypothetical protein
VSCWRRLDDTGGSYWMITTVQGPVLARRVAEPSKTAGKPRVTVDYGLIKRR